MTNLNYGFYIGVTEEDMCYILDTFGLLFSKEDLLFVANGLLKFAEKYGDNIEQINIQRKKEQEEKEKRWLEECEVKNQKRKQKSKVYIIECGGKYKIGITKDINRRIKELNNRPFSCKVLYLSKNSEYAYEVEQHVHYELAESRINGEWYKLHPKMIDFLKEEIEEVMRCYEEKEYDETTLKTMREESPERFIGYKGGSKKCQMDQK